MSSRRVPIVVLVASCAALLAACAPPPGAAPEARQVAPPLGSVSKVPEISAPLYPETSDPSVVRVDDVFYMYGSDNHLRAPITLLSDLHQPMNWFEKYVLTTEGMPTKPAWAAHERQLWAPTVGRFGDRWVMYFAADRKDPPQPHNAQCIGRAFASSPSGPFVAEARPWHCGLRAVGGALDPELFTDVDGTRWLHAAFSDTEAPLHAIPLDGSGNRTGDAVEILPRVHPWEYHFLEQPAMLYDPARKDYLLTYSAGRWYEAGYSTGVARCTTPAGPCRSDARGPWLSSASGRSGPGGLSFFDTGDGTILGIFATFAAGAETTIGGRSASIMEVQLRPTLTLRPHQAPAPPPDPPEDDPAPSGDPAPTGD